MKKDEKAKNETIYSKVYSVVKIRRAIRSLLEITICYSLILDRVASNIIAAIRQGHDTFGKIRKALDYDDLSLKASLRHAHNWLPIIERSGSVQRPQLTRKQARVESNGRRYSVVIV